MKGKRRKNHHGGGKWIMQENSAPENEYRCKQCNKLLAKGLIREGTNIGIKCDRCKDITFFNE